MDAGLFVTARTDRLGLLIIRDLPFLDGRLWKEGFFIITLAMVAASYLEYF